VLYTKGLFALLDGFRRAALDILAPQFQITQGLSSKPDPKDAVIGKLDAAEEFELLRLRLGELVEEPRLIELITDVAQTIDRKNVRDISRILELDLSGDGTLRTYLARFIGENVRLIRSVSFEQLGRMEEIVRLAQSGQTRVETLREDILASFDVSKSRATLIARDQTLKANSDLTQLRQQRAGVQDYIWTTSRDERVRGKPGGKWADTESDHWSLDGTRQSWLSPPVTNPSTGARNHPGRDFQCRCVAIPVIPEDILEGL
jgi:SPP1 gp7 family putative phage head morphogenesis protein